MLDTDLLQLLAEPLAESIPEQQVIKTIELCFHLVLYYTRILHAHRRDILSPAEGWWPLATCPLLLDV